METILYISLFFLLIFCIMAAMSHSILKSAIYLAAASAMLGVVMYVLGAQWASVIEVSACSGLVTVIFISAISLSKMKKDEVQNLYNDKKQMAYLPVFLIIGGVLLFVIAFLAKDFALTSVAEKVSEDFREIFWNTRQADILGQIITILAGGIAVFVLFRDDDIEK